MAIELTPRSLELIAQQQREHGAISPEHLIEQALEAFSGLDTRHTVTSLDELRTRIEEAWADAEQNGSMPAEQAWEEIHKALGA